MTQRVDYEALPGTRYDQYATKIRLMLGALAGPDGAAFKPFRDFLRRNGLWDKDKAPTMLSLLDLTYDRKGVTQGPFAQQLAATSSDEELKDLLYKRLCDDNILLVKYVFEALDVDSGGRLHSVHELYRMITSYVYPGEYVSLTNFQAWVEWMAATGYIRLVGIRWALSDKGKAVVGELRSLDTEEILEDMEEEAAEERAGQVAAPAPAPASPAPRAVDAPATGRRPDEDAADLPPEPKPPSDADIAKAEAAFLQRFGAAEPEPEPAPEAPLEGPMGVGAKATSPAAVPGLPAGGPRAPLPAPPTSLHAQATVGLGPGGQAVVDNIIEAWNELGDWPVYTAPDLGVETHEAAPEGDDGSRDDGSSDEAPPGAAKDPCDLLLELCTLAVLIEGLPPQPQVFAFVQRMRDRGFFGLLAGDGGFTGALAALGDLHGAPWTRPLVERLVHVPALVRRVNASGGFMDKLRAAPSGRHVVLALREELFGDAMVEAPFWVTRELVRLGLLPDPAQATATAVPSRRLQRNAHRLGLVPRPQETTFAGLLAVSEKATELFGARGGHGEALEVMDRMLGLGA